MFCTIYAGAVWGISAYMVGVEVDVDKGLPSFGMVGLLGHEVRESKERVRVALKNAGLDIPPMRITVNLSPADRKKEGTAFDLAIAVGILKALDYFPDVNPEDTLFLGELGLDGEVKKVRGVLPIVREAAAQGIRRCIVPRANAAEGAVIPGVEVRAVSDIREVILFLTNPKEADDLLPVVRVDARALFETDAGRDMPDFQQVKGQESAKRAAMIAAAGFHNLLLYGPPGAGKSMIAKRICGIMPRLSLEESLEVTSVMSVAGMLGEDASLITGRPFQDPHHTVSQAAMLGGSSSLKPGLISMAHRGVLFLDELPEFQRAVLDSLRQPLEERRVQVSRISGTVTYPADFMLVAAMNPCPCGYFPDKNKCRCTEVRVNRYMDKISGPILDRIDLCVELERVTMAGAERINGMSSREMRERVIAGRKMQEARFRGTPYRFNGDIEVADMERFCALGPEEQVYMEQLYETLQMSARTYHKVLKVARTIADLDGAEAIGVTHLLEAACYRPSQEYWR